MSDVARGAPGPEKLGKTLRGGQRVLRKKSPQAYAAVQRGETP